MGSFTGAYIEGMQDNMDLKLRYWSTAWTEIAIEIEKRKRRKQEEKKELEVGKRVIILDLDKKGQT